VSASHDLYRYSVSQYGDLICHRERMVAYEEALRRAVRPGSVVVDIGAGCGILSFLACRFGARRVFSLEPNDAVLLGKEIAAENGVSDRIEFIQELSTDINLPERADVVVSDLRGVLPLFEMHLPTIVDARERFLAPGGTLIGQRDRLWAAVVEAPEVYEPLADPWVSGRFDLDLRLGRRFALNVYRKVRLKPNQLLTEPQCWAELDYRLLTEPDVSADVEWDVTRTGLAHGIALWFDASLIDGVEFGSGPGEPDSPYGMAFLSWLEPVEVLEGDKAAVHLEAKLLGGEYTWRWDSRVLEKGNRQQIKASFKQSSFLATPHNPNRLRKCADDYIPELGEDGQVEQLILDLMDGQATLQAIAETVSGRFPARYPSWEDALARVAEASKDFSR